MSRTPRLTDAVLRAALMPAAGEVTPPALLGSIGTEIRRTPQTRPPLRLPGLADLADRLDPRRTRQLVLVLAAVGLVAALLGGALVAGRFLGPLFAPPRTPLVPTSVEMLTPNTGLVDRVVVDGAGTYWAIGPGRLTRFDPATGERRSWTVSDDVAFDAGVVAPARAGGVWIVSGETIRRFDGEGFVELISGAPVSTWALEEAPDGALWAASFQRGLLRWDGTAWVVEPPGRPTGEVGAVLALGSDEVWVANPRQADFEAGETGPVGAGVSHLRDGSWVTYDGADAPQLRGAIVSIERAADGSIWVTMDASMSGDDPGIARFDGRAWTTVPGPGFPASWLEAAPDGSMWAITGESATLEVARHRDGAWTTYGARDGLAGSELGRVSATPAGVFLGTNAGLFRFDGERWSRAWPEGTGPRAGQALLAAPGGEVWAADDLGIWHYRDGSWNGISLPGDLVGASVAALALGPDGALWAATDRGVGVMRDGRWTIASAAAASAIAVGADGTAWVGGEADAITRIAADGGDSYVARTIACPVHPRFVAVATDGSVYLGDFSFSTPASGLARVDGRFCEKLDPLGDGSTPDVVGLAAHPDDGVVAHLFGKLPGYPGGGRWSSDLVRVDGDRATIIEHLATVDGTSGILAVAPNGDVWRRPWDRPGLERFDGERWTMAIDGVEVVGPVAVAPDGAVYFVGPSGLQRYVPPVEP